MVTPGLFHTTMNYLGIFTGHNCNGSGYSELLVNPKLAIRGCLASVLSDKAYAKTIFSFFTVCEALPHLLMEKFIEQVNSEEHNPEFLINLL